MRTKLEENHKSWRRKTAALNLVKENNKRLVSLIGVTIDRLDIRGGW